MQRRQDLDRAHKEHGDPGDDDGVERFVMSRVDDYSFWFRWAYKMQKYAILWVPLAWLMTSLGFGYFTPHQKVNELKMVVDSNRTVLQSEIDALKDQNVKLTTTLDQTLEAVKTLQRFSCVDPKVSVREKIIAGLPCS